MLARVRECQKLGRLVSSRQMSKLHFPIECSFKNNFKDMTSIESIMCPFIASYCGSFHWPWVATATKMLQKKVYSQIFSHHRVNFLQTRNHLCWYFLLHIICTLPAKSPATPFFLLENACKSQLCCFSACSTHNVGFF